MVYSTQLNLLSDSIISFFSERGGGIFDETYNLATGGRILRYTRINLPLRYGPPQTVPDYPGYSSELPDERTPGVSELGNHLGKSGAIAR